MQQRLSSGGLAAILQEIEAIVGSGQTLGARDLDRILRKHPKDGKGLHSKHELIEYARGRRGAESLRRLGAHLRKKPVRSQSGVAPVTVFTRPHPCPGRCVFCPTDERMPKSYLPSEPGCQRAVAHGFDPYAQTRSRLRALHGGGHAVDKVELIVLGGTWSSYPEAYRSWFLMRCFDALNDFAGGSPPGSERKTPRHREGGTAAFERARWDELEVSLARNESARCRSVGLVVETRPDRVDDREILCLRRMGVTKVQLGVQSLSEEILQRNRRGHGVAATRDAFLRLRGAGFKLQAHWMANLLGATPEGDIADFARLFADAAFRPDEVKIYPCSLVESADLASHHHRGDWRPYGPEELVRVVSECMQAVPRYCRVSRVVRDIPATEILAGSRVGNLREVAERRLLERGRAATDIRSREIRGEPVRPGELRLRICEYETSAGGEEFLEFVTREDRIAAFARLALPRRSSPIREIEDHALVRELHVYGAALDLGERSDAAAQHAGLGRRLLREVARRARRAGYPALSVISAVGTRPYYRASGFSDGELYQSLRLRAQRDKKRPTAKPTAEPASSSTGV